MSGKATPNEMSQAIIEKHIVFSYQLTGKNREHKLLTDPPLIHSFFLFIKPHSQAFFKYATKQKSLSPFLL